MRLAFQDEEEYKDKDEYTHMHVFQEQYKAKDEYDLDEDLNGDDVEMYLRQHVGLNQVTSA